MTTAAEIASEKNNLFAFFGRKYNMTAVTKSNGSNMNAEEHSGVIRNPSGVSPDNPK
ncbi:hypothetical protein GCM10027598_12090 [Amycolatopsis oliviviridis]|uniref:Uncharacterized protein n=1 Tax=Amycolatopsis oliviviridis TaxID=1471590 RepID=A0ABQ3LV11_9PSEU|nr:hypothetical protein GCM10017790_54040 [Amycolatopsis oliviviridis]